MKCPKCTSGSIIKGKNSYGCSEWKAGCDMRVPFEFMNKKLTHQQVKRLLEKKATTKLKGFVLEGEKVEGIVKLTNDFQLEFENKTKSQSPVPGKSGKPLCPKCKKGTLIKGKTAYGCSDWKSGCDFRYPFELIKSKANGRPLTKELVLQIISA
ncbi:DNA topoisomerase III [Fulvivirga imtechensis AK7]|uniref:DNA topoisomerase III n=1 Tax=Fulvivirga imtechensis AK7 TaxID=1237149 RepID=L8JI11_9BACT|nr:DNA topoisomerase III [Fulvivirga imtechensis AK7]